MPRTVGVAAVGSATVGLEAVATVAATAAEATVAATVGVVRAVARAVGATAAARAAGARVAARVAGATAVGAAEEMAEAVHARNEACTRGVRIGRGSHSPRVLQLTGLVPTSHTAAYGPLHVLM
jgi:hypothetical protein